MADLSKYEQMFQLIANMDVALDAIKDPNEREAELIKTLRYLGQTVLVLTEDMEKIDKAISLR